MALSLHSSSPNLRPECFPNMFSECVFVFTVMLATDSATFIQGVIIINSAMMGRDLEMTATQITWISASVGLSSGSFILFFGKTADVFGSNLQFLVGMAFLSVFSLVTAFANKPLTMDILCGLLGFGTAIIGPPVIGIVLAKYPEGRRRNRVMRSLGAGNPVGFILGGISAGLATNYYSWRASFVVIAAFFSVMTLYAFWIIPETKLSGKPLQLLREFDYMGMALTTIGMALVTAALTEAPEIGWKNYRPVLTFGLGIFCLVGFGMWENFFPRPLINPSVWKNTSFSLCVLCTLFGYMSFITNQFWLSLYMQDIQNLSPLHIAARMLPQAVAGIVWSYIGQWLVSRISGTIIMGIGSISYAIGAALCYFIEEDTSYWMVLFPQLCITVIGADLQFVVSNFYIAKEMPNQLYLAAGILQTAMRLSIVIGLSITAGVYGSAARTDKGQSNINISYQKIYICSIAFAVFSLLVVPFLHIDTQGKRPSSDDEADITAIVPQKTLNQPHLDHASIANTEISHRNQISHHKTSQNSLSSVATAGSINCYFPRWSWEPELVFPDDLERCKSGVGAINYEFCVYGMHERKVIVPNIHTSLKHCLDPGSSVTTFDLQQPDRLEDRRFRNGIYIEGFYSDSYAEELQDWKNIEGRKSKIGIPIGECDETCAYDSGYPRYCSHRSSIYPSDCQQKFGFLSKTARRTQSSHSFHDGIKELGRLYPPQRPELTTSEDMGMIRSSPNARESQKFSSSSSNASSRDFQLTSNTRKPVISNNKTLNDGRLREFRYCNLAETRPPVSENSSIMATLGGALREVRLGGDIDHEKRLISQP